VLARGLRSGDVAGRVLGLAHDEDHLHRLVPEQAVQHGAVARGEGGLVDVVLVRVDRALHDVLAEAVGAVDEHDVAEA
jgi:hypothetical protein